MKDKILTFIIGVLVGAIIMTVAFYIYVKINNKPVNAMFNEEMPKMMQQENMETPPEKPSERQLENGGENI